MIRQQHKMPWYLRFAERLGLDPLSGHGRNAIAGTSKHGRAKTKPRNWKRHAKMRRKMADTSRRRNRVIK